MTRILLLSTLLLIALTTVMLQYTRDSVSAPPPPSNDAAGSGEALVGGDFTLTDQHGKTVKDADFRGRLMLVFFGFTHCPDICPVTSKTLSDVMTLLDKRAAQVAPVFISVDPARDAPEVMKAFFAHFDPRIVALTGSDEQVKQAAAAYKAYYAKSAPAHDGAHGEGHGDHHAAANGYMVDHSGYVYLMNLYGKYVTHFPFDVSPQALADALKPHLE